MLSSDFVSDGKVSIPFKREGTFRLPRSLRSAAAQLHCCKFQFPSNGKAHSDFKGGFLDEIRLSVSIPFKREGTFRREYFGFDGEAAESFNSLQTGRHIQTMLNRSAVPTCLSFMSRFNSLQTGRHIQTKSTDRRPNHKWKQFQVPSNGKAHSDCSAGAGGNREGDCFNSLQTGRHIQTTIWLLKQRRQILFQFPSNGKAHSDVYLKEACGLVKGMVSIPFKREGTFRLYIRVDKLVSLIVSIPFKREGTFRPCEIPVLFISCVMFQFPSNGKAHSDKRHRF